MLIRSTRHACFVMLRNGLTLELAYDLGAHSNALWDAWDALGDPLPSNERPSPRSQGVWMFREEVVLEVKVGQA